MPGAGNGQVPELPAHGVTGATELRYLYEESLELDPATAREVLRRRWPFFVALPLLFALGSFVLAGRGADEYESQATVALEPSVTDGVFVDSTDRSTDARLAQTEAELAEGSSVRDAVAAVVGSPVEYTVAAHPSADLLTVTATSSSPDEAQQVASLVATTYVAQRRQRTVDSINAAIAQVQAQVQRLEGEIAALGPGASDTQRASLQGELSGQRSQLSTLQVAAGVETGGARVASDATRPDDPVAKPVRMAAVFGLLLGGIVAAAVAALLESRRRRLVTADAGTYGASGEIPVLGHVPYSVGRRALASRDDALSMAAERFRMLATTLESGFRRDGSTVVAIAGTANGAGGSYVAANTAASLSANGFRTALVDADLRGGNQHTLCGVRAEHGLSNVLGGQTGALEALVSVPGCPRLTLLAAGPRPAFPSELLAGGRIERVIEELRRFSDVVVVNAPPVLPVADALVVSRAADLTLLVVASETTRRSELHEAITRLDRAGTSLIGLVLTGGRSGPKQALYPAQQRGRVARLVRPRG